VAYTEEEAKALAAETEVGRGITVAAVGGGAQTQAAGVLMLVDFRLQIALGMMHLGRQSQLPVPPHLNHMHLCTCR
jgi:hypothetical protein